MYNQLVIKSYNDKREMIKNTQKPQEIAQVLSAGGIVLLPTETLYGIGCDATNPQALLKIYKLKQRPFGKAFPILVRDIKMLADYANFNADQKKAILAAKQPTNFVLKAKNLSPLTTQKHTAAFRIAKHLFIKRIFKYFDKPIVATSANVSKQEPIADPALYRDAFGRDAELIDAVVFAGINRKKKGSRIIDLTKKPYSVLRA